MFASIMLAASSYVPGGILVVDEAGAGVPAAAVVFVDRSGQQDDETTDPTGEAAPRTGFAALSATVAKGGFVTAHVTLNGTHLRVVLERTLGTIGRVTVATGTARSAHDLPVATSVLDSAAIGGAPAPSADRLLRDLPGADYTRSNSAFTNYGQLRASFSGAGSDRGVVLVDGIPAQDAFGGQIDWQAYPNVSLVRAELLRGAGSALYGSGAVGGVLNFETFGPQTGTPVEGRVRVGGGSNDQSDNALLLSAPLSNQVAASVVMADSKLSYNDLAPGYTAPDDHPAVSFSGVTKLGLRYAGGGTTVDAAGIFASDQQDEGRTNYTFDRTLRQQSVVVSHALGSVASAGLGFYSRDTTVYNIDDLFPTKPGVLRYVQHVPTHEDGLFATLSDSPGPIEYQLRIDQRRVEGNSRQDGPLGVLQALGTGTELLQGVAFQATYQTGRFEALAGARADRLRYDDLSLINTGQATQNVAGHDEGAISPRVALRYDLTKQVALRVSGGDGFRGPFLNELVRGFNVGKIFEAPNPDLVPERSRSYSAGLDELIGSRGRLSFDLVQTNVTDAIAFVTVTPTLMKRENIDRTQTESETLSYAQALGTCSRVRVSGTTQTPEVTAGPAGTIGKQLAFIPKASADVGLDAGSRGPLSYSLDGAYVGQTYADSLQQEPLGAALLFGATLRATTKSGTSFELTGDNLTRQVYLTSVDRLGPPQTVSLHVEVPIGPAATEGTCRL
jgi:outer membrane cobalamin receptor